MKIDQKTGDVLLLGGIVLAGIGLRLAGLFDPLVGIHDFRETQTASGVWLYSRFGFDLFEYHVAMFGGKYWILEFPLYQALIFGLSKIFGAYEVMGRLVSILSYAASCLALYAIARKILRDRARPLLAVLVFSVVPFAAYFSRAFMIDSLVLALALDLKEKFAPRKAVLAGILFFAAVMIKVTTVVAVAVPALWLFVSGIAGSPAGKRRRRLLASGAALAVIGLAYLAWQSYGFRMNARSFMLAKADLVNWYFGVRLFQPAFYQTLWMRASHEFGFIGLFSLVLGGYALWKDKEAGRTPLLLWAASVLAYVAVFNNLNFIHIYYQLPLVPFLAVFAAAGMAAVGRTFAGNRKAAIVCAGILLFYCGERALTYAKSYLLYSPEYKQRMLDSAAAIRANTTEGETVVLAWPGADPNLPNFLYLAKRIGYNVDLNRIDAIRSVLAHDPAVRRIVAFPVRPENVEPLLKSLGAQGVRVGDHRVLNSMLFIRVEGPGKP